ncbi:MAG: serine protease [Candidatus Bathyarchaeota archaeon]|nr:serine protease [Candidatus Bathyarchaeota archaeon]
MPVLIDEFSVKPLYLETFLVEQRLGVATGFAVKKDASYYLITNWHVVTGRNPFDNNRPLSARGLADPNKLKVWFHGQNLGSWIAKEIELINRAGDKLWLEHELPEQVDVVAIPFAVTEDIRIYEIDLALADFDLMVYPSEAVSIIGFPMGLTSGGKFPIWKTGHIASDIDIDWDGKPAFLIDATTKSGMSGSPVIAKRVSLYQTSHGNVVGNAARFLGVYSGREIGESGVEVGFVWKPRVISEILGH